MVNNWLARAKAKARAMARVRDRAGTRISDIENIYWTSEIIQIIKNRYLIIVCILG